MVVLYIFLYIDLLVIFVQINLIISFFCLINSEHSNFFQLINAIIEKNYVLNSVLTPLIYKFYKGKTKWKTTILKEQSFQD